MLSLQPLVRALTLLAALCLATSVLAQAPKSRLHTVLEKGVLRVGTTGDFNPMSILDPATKTYKGFDIEAMEQLAKDLGVKVEWVSTEWATLVQGIQAGHYDIFSGASLNMARAKVVAFSEPYFEAGTVPLIQRSTLPKIKGWTDLNQKGVNVAVLMGTVFEEQAKQHFPNATVKSIQKPANGYQEVLAGRADATITSNVEAATLMQTYPNLTMIGSAAEMRNKRPFAYPMPQGDTAWITYVNNWVALKRSEGFFQALEAKWMPRK